MAGGTMSAVVRGLERLFTVGGVTNLTEGQLLDRFVSLHDSAAFEAIVLRHGPMVRGVCKRWLRDPNDVDDAFQATFLVLAKKASTLRRRELLGNWLYGVAYRIALRARANAAHRLAHETPTEGVGELAVVSRSRVEDAPELHEEVHRLPEKYRTPVVLCYLEGLTHEEAADRLRWPVGTVKGRLARAKDLLRSRLVRRGVTLGSSAAVAEALVHEAGAANSLPEALVESTVKAAALAVAGKTAVASGLISAQALSLSEGAIHAMYLTKLKTLAATLAVAATLTTGAGVYAYQSAGGGKPETTKDSTRATETKVVTTTVDARKSASPVNSASDPFAKSIERFKVDRDAEFEKLLKSSVYMNWRPEDAERLITWSSAVEETQQSVDPTPANGDAALRGHLHRMKRLFETIESLETSDRVFSLKIAAEAYRKTEQRIADRAAERSQTAKPQDAKGQPVDPLAPTPAATTTTGTGAGSAPPRDPNSSSIQGTHSGPLPPMPGAGAGEAGGGGFGGGGGVSEPTIEEIEKQNAIRVLIAELGAKVETEDMTPATQAALKKLGLPVVMSFAHETPLEDVLKYIKHATQGSNSSGIPIYVDPLGLQDAEKTTTSTVQIDLEGIPLKTSLRLMLKQLGLAYCVKDGLVIISSPRGILDELREYESATTPLNKRIPPGGMQNQGGFR